MFRAGNVTVPPLPRDSLVSGKHGAYDAERAVTVAWIQGMRELDGEAWLLNGNGEFLPFELLSTPGSTIGESQRDISLLNFGGSADLALSIGVHGRTLYDSDETRGLMVLAIEGVLVAHTRIRPRYWRPPVFKAMGREWRLGDFGYAEECGRAIV